MSSADPHPSVVDHLRRVTRAEHRAAERAFDLKASTRSLGAYRRLLERLWGLHLIWEQRALNVLAVQLLGPRLKAQWLRSDLQAMGLSEEAIARITLCPLPMQLRTASQALGALYVLEHSTLAGQVIYREAAETLALTPERYGRFFYGYGMRTAAMWKGFGDLLQSRYADGELNLEEASIGAKAMFVTVTTWLGQAAGLPLRGLTRNAGVQRELRSGMCRK